MLGDVNISAILDSFSVSYDKRVRPNYGGEYGIVNTMSCLFVVRGTRADGRPRAFNERRGAEPTHSAA